jgi:hypothetical protein
MAHKTANEQRLVTDSLAVNEGKWVSEWRPLKLPIFIPGRLWCNCVHLVYVSLDILFQMLPIIGNIWKTLPDPVNRMSKAT